MFWINPLPYRPLPDVLHQGPVILIDAEFKENLNAYRFFLFSVGAYSMAVLRPPFP